MMALGRSTTSDLPPFLTISCAYPQMFALGAELKKSNKLWPNVIHHSPELASQMTAAHLADATVEDGRSAPVPTLEIAALSSVSTAEEGVEGTVQSAEEGPTIAIVAPLPKLLAIAEALKSDTADLSSVEEFFAAETSRHFGVLLEATKAEDPAAVRFDHNAADPSRRIIVTF